VSYETGVSVWTSTTNGAYCFLKDAPEIKQALKDGACPNEIIVVPPLHWAASLCDKETVDALLDGGAKLEMRDRDAGFTPLLTAARYGNLEALDTLIERGGDVNAQNGRGHTALRLMNDHWCERSTEEKSVASIKKLMKAGADMDIPDNSGSTLRDSHNYDEVQSALAAHDKQELIAGLGKAWKPSDCKDESSSAINCQPRELRKRKM
jgi:ankyrin repeat protein